MPPVAFPMIFELIKSMVARTETASKMNHHRWIKQCFFQQLMQTKEVLKIRILCDLFNRFLVSDPKPFLDQ